MKKNPVKKNPARCSYCSKGFDDTELLISVVWAPALLTTWEPGGETTRYMVSLDPDSIHGIPAWRVDAEIRKPA